MYCAKKTSDSPAPCMYRSALSRKFTAVWPTSPENLPQLSPKPSNVKLIISYAITLNDADLQGK